MAVNPTRNPGQVWVDNTPPQKAWIVQLLNELIAAINGIDPQLAALLADLQTRRVASTASSDFSGTTFPVGTGTVIFRSSTNVSIWQALTIAPDPVTATHQQDATGAWWGRAFQLSDIRNALRNAGVFSLTGIGGTANAITASFADAAQALGVTVDSSTIVEVTPTVANTGPVTLQISGDTARTIQTENGTALPAGFLRPGVSIMLRRVGANWRALSSVTSDQLAAARNEAATATALEASARADADGFQRAALRQGAITLVNVSLTGNAYTADIEGTFTSVAMTDIPVNGEVTVSFPATNPSQNPTLNGRGLRRRNGSPWPAGKIIPGSPYTLKRIGNEMRVLSGDVQGEELESGLASVARKLVTITTASSPGERNSTAWTQAPGSYSFTGVAITGAPAVLASPHSADVQVEQVVDGLRQVWLDASGRRFERLRKAGAWGDWLEIAREDRVAALETAVNAKASQADLTTLQAAVESIEAVAVQGSVKLFQTGPALPVRPDGVTMQQSVEWWTWDSPQAVMGVFDAWITVPAPNEPQVPAAQSWDVYNARDGKSVAIIIRSVPTENPPIIGIDRRVGGDEAPWLALPSPAAGPYVVGGFATGPQAVAIRHVSYVGAGEGDLDRTVTVSAADEVADLSGANLLLFNARPAKWQNLIADMAITTRGLIVNSGVARVTHSNQFVRALYRDYFVTQQFVRAQIVTLSNTAHLNSFDGIGLGVNGNGVNAIRALFRPGQIILQYIENNGSRRTLATHSAAYEFPFTAEIRRTSINEVQVRVNGNAVITHNLTGDAAASLTGGLPEIYAFVASGGTPANTGFSNLVMGHA